LTLSNLSQVYDGNPKSVTVVVSPDASVAYTVTYNGSATAPTAVGTYSVVATVSDPNYTGTASATLTITAASAPDISVSISNGRSYVQYGKTLTNTIVVQNIGTADASSVTVAAALPVTLVNGNWTCVGYTGATCGAASGSGDLSDTAVVPQNGVLVYTFAATANDDQSLATDQIAMTATVTVNGTPADSNPANNTATTPVTQIVIFRDGFETGGDGAQNAAATTLMSSMGAKSTLSLDPATAPQGQNAPQAWLRGVDASGRTVFEVETLHIGTLSLMRLSVSDANGNLVLGAWIDAQQFAFGFAGSGGKYQVMLASSKANVQVSLPTWVVLPVQVYTTK
ncbi:MAG TPA: MBG domain-containing protein, partial [Rudaea sp.]|nr:MBG domain-containing protein [Rudaea sp.]